MGEPGGIKGPFPQQGKTEAVSGGPGQGETVPNILHTKVKTLGDMKEVLIQNLGKEKGEKFYNSFLKSFAITVLNQVQQSDKRAEEAAKKMGEDQQ